MSKRPSVSLTPKDGSALWMMLRQTQTALFLRGRRFDDDVQAAYESLAQQVAGWMLKCGICGSEYVHDGQRRPRSGTILRCSKCRNNRRKKSAVIV